MSFPEIDNLTHSPVRFASFLDQPRKLVQTLALGVVTAGAILVSGSSVSAAESITLRFDGREQTFEVSNIARFVATGEAATPDIQAYFEREPEVRRLVQSIFGAEIFISPTFLANVETELRSPTADFILIQLSKLVSTPTNPELTDALRTAVFDALGDDNRLSLIEIIERYPETSVRVDLTGLETVYNDVAQFVERVLPALEVAKQYLQTIICDCETQSANSSASQSRLASGPAAAGVASGPAGVKTLSQPPCPPQGSQAGSTQASSTQAGSTQASSTQTSPAQTSSTQTSSTQTSSTQTSSTQATTPATPIR